VAGNLEIVNVSDVGRKRPHNEDSTVSDARHGLVMVADGMGGYKAGEVASAIAVTNILRDVTEGLKHVESGKIDSKTGYSQESILVENAIKQANSTIYSTAQRDAQCHGMGTTVVMGLFIGDKILIANVGDSRLYRHRNNKFQQITKDHSLYQEVIDRGLYTPEEAAINTPRNLVTRALGIDAKVEVDIFEDQLLKGDIYLLCSDGLNDMVKDEEIHLTLSKYSANLVQTAEKLIQKANGNGGKDNISVVLVHVNEIKTNTNIKRNLFSRLFNAGG
jgi:protein phosphatase